MATPARAPISKEVFVHIIVDPSNAKEPIRVYPGRFWVSKKAQQEVVWHCTSTDPRDPHPNFTVDFSRGKNGSPFSEPKFDEKHPYSGLVRSEAMNSTDEDQNSFYEYTVTVGDKKLDPDGGVHP